MTPKHQFALCVQTICIVRDITENHQQAASILGHAMAEPDDAVAERIARNEGNISDAAREFVSEVTGE
jgi:hypothetical protein